MAYRELFESVAEHVRRQGVKVRFACGTPLAPAAMDHARAEAFIPIPPSLIDVYAEIGDGLEFGWSSKGKNAPFANHEICKLDACAPKSIDDVSWLTEWRDDYEFPHVEDSALAKKTALKRQANRVPVTCLIKIFRSLKNGFRLALNFAGMEDHAQRSRRNRSFPCLFRRNPDLQNLTLRPRGAGSSVG